MNNNQKNILNQFVATLLVETNEGNRKKIWRKLVENTNQKLINFLLKNFLNLTIYQIETIVQDTYLKFNEQILKKRESKQVVFLDKKLEKVENIFAYLYKIARNEAILVSKKATKTEFLHQNYDTKLQTEAVIDENQLSELEYRSKYLAISAINPHSQREAFYTFIQFEFQKTDSNKKYTNADIAKLINAPSANAVTQRKKEAKKKYIQLLKNYRKRIEQTENITLGRIEKKIKQKLTQYFIFNPLLKSQNIEELEILLWQVILLTTDKNFENYCNFFLFDSLKEASNKENQINFSELNYIFNHWIENKITYESLINPKLKQS